MSQLADHLWQSTVFAALAGLLTLALRTNRAQVRHWVWLAASCKFLIPFSMFIALGGQIQWRTAPPVARSAIAVVTQPFTPLAASPAPTVVPLTTNQLPTILVAIWLLGFIGIACSWWVRWRRIAASVRAGSPLHLDLPIKAISSRTLLEPGVFGVFRPVLLLPEGIFDRLSPAQLQAVIAHELCHVRHRDNLVAAIHMFVETVFWFHPLVWWIGKRMVDERERACDEEVLRVFGEPKAYAEGILNVCKLYTESPLKCVSGVTGSNLKKRLEAIMSNRIAHRLTFAKKAVLATAGAAAIAIPIFMGVLNAPFLRAQSTLVGTPGQRRPAFEVAAVKWIDRSKMQRNHEGHLLTPERFVDRTELMQFISMAYIRGDVCTLKAARGEDCPLIAGSVPAWARNDRFEIIAKIPANSIPGYTARQVRSGDTPEVDLMLQRLLEDRFQLKVHREMRELPVYALTMVKSGPKLKNSPRGSERLKAKDGSPIEVHGASSVKRTPMPDGASRMRLNFQASSMENVANFLAESLDRPILDQTGLKGDYDFVIEYEEDPAANAGEFPSLLGRTTVSALSVALQNVGLKLESKKAPVAVLVIDHVERPSEN